MRREVLIVLRRGCNWSERYILVVGFSIFVSVILLEFEIAKLPPLGMV